MAAGRANAPVGLNSLQRSFPLPAPGALELRSSKYKPQGTPALSGPVPDALKPFLDVLAELLADAVLRQHVAEAVARPVSARQTEAEAGTSADATTAATRSPTPRIPIHDPTLTT